MELRSVVSKAEEEILATRINGKRRRIEAGRLHALSNAAQGFRMTDQRGPWRTPAAAST